MVHKAGNIGRQQPQRDVDAENAEQQAKRNADNAQQKALKVNGLPLLLFRCAHGGQHAKIARALGQRNTKGIVDQCNRRSNNDDKNDRGKHKERCQCAAAVQKYQVVPEQFAVEHRLVKCDVGVFDSGLCLLG